MSTIGKHIAINVGITKTQLAPLNIGDTDVLAISQNKINGLKTTFAN